LTIIFIMLFSSIGSASALSSTYMTSPYYTKLSNVLNAKTGNQRTDIVNIALSQVGYLEGSITGTTQGSNNLTEYGNWLGQRNAAWCAAFVAWCANLAGVSTSEIRETASPGSLCPKWNTYTSSSKVKAGDVLNINNGAHSALVWKVDGTYIYTVEGNMSNRVRSDVKYYVSSGKCTWSNYSAKISSFYSPNYKTSSGGVSTPSAPAVNNKINVTSSFPSEGIKEGTVFKITGTATSNYKVGSVTATITGGGITQSFDSGLINVSSYDLSNLNKTLKIERLPEGNYYIRINMKSVASSTVASKSLTWGWTFKIVHTHNLKTVTLSTASCKSEGLQETSCAGCSYKEKKVLAKLSHVPKAEPTCTTAQTCTVCGEVLRPAKGHAETTLNAKVATCTNTGLTEGKKCTICKTVTVAQKKIAAKGHSEVILAGKAATCTEAGLTEGKKCSVCGTVTVAQQTIGAKGHSEVIVAGKAATCTETGLTEGKKCSVCGTVTVAQQTIGAKGHSEVIVAGKLATCTESGLTEGKKCSVCQTIIATQMEIPAIPHTSVTKNVTSATTDEYGSIDEKCSCGVTLSSSTISRINTVKLSTSSYTYNGKVKSPKVIIIDSDGHILEKNVDYAIKTPQGRKHIGKYTYTVEFKGNYEGTKKLTLTIKPTKPTLKKVTATKKTVNVKWTKGKKAQVTGYEVIVATNKNFTKGKKFVKVKGYAKTSVKVNKLKIKTKYFVKARTYKTVKGEKIYSDWSKVKVIRTK